MSAATKELKLQSVGIVGTGRLGSALARALLAAGYELAVVASFGGQSAGRLARSLGASVRALPVAEVPAQASLIFLAVPDGRIESVCEALPVHAGHAVVHTSGAQGLAPLASARAAGAQVGAFHPLQSFSESAGPGAFGSISIGVEAEGALAAALQRCCERLGARALWLQGVDRARYHAAAVFASNYVVALQLAAAQAWELAGLPRAQAEVALAPLTLAAAQNLLDAEPARALTGPVARGDVQTVERHLAALADNPELLLLYRALGAQLLQLPLALTPETRARLEHCFVAATPAD
ncbi:MAG TPA: DUF2520 domain-containing protein [Polyangiales bacterium]